MFIHDKIDEKIGKSEGKIIRNIDIVSLDPFGYSDEDENREPHNSFEIFGNKIHREMG